MYTFQQYLLLQSLDPLIREAAEKIVQAEVDPDLFLAEFCENWFDDSRTHAQSAASHFAGGAYDTARAAGHLARGAAQGAAGVGNWLRNTGKSLWDRWNAPERRLRKAVAILTKLSVDPKVTAYGGHRFLMGIIKELNQFLADYEHGARAMPAPAAAPAPTGGPVPATSVAPTGDDFDI